MGVAEPCGLVPWGGGGLGREVVEGSAWSPWAPRSVRGGRRGAGGCAPGWGRPGWGVGSWGEVVSFLRAEGPGRRPGARLCPPRWAGGWPVTIGVPLSESIQVRVRVLRLDGEAAVRVRTTQVRDSAPWSSGSSTALAPPCGLAPHPVPPGFAEAVETTPLGHGARPRARGPPGRGPAERDPAPPPPWAAGPGVSRPGPVRARAPAASQPGEQVGGRHPPASAPGEGPDPPGDRPRAAARRKQSGTRSGRPHAAPAPGVRGHRHSGPQAPDEKRRYSTPT